MALHEIIITTLASSQICQNIFHYESVGTPAAVSRSFGLASAFGAIPVPATVLFPADTPMGLWQELLSANVDFTAALAQDIYPNDDFYENVYTGVIGGVGIAPASPVVSVGFRTSRTDRNIRRGTKRFAGIPNTIVASGGSIDPSARAGWDAFGDKLAEVLEYDDDGNTISYIPTIVSKKRYTVPGSSPARYAYQYYDTLAEQLEHVSQGFTWERYSNIRTQTSRQYGRGI